jgi:hypothetical protein
MAAGPFRSGFEAGCLIMFGLFALLLMLGKCAQWMGQ